MLGIRQSKSTVFESWALVTFGPTPRSFLPHPGQVSNDQMRRACRLGDQKVTWGQEAGMLLGEAVPGQGGEAEGLLPSILHFLKVLRDHF